MKKTLLVASSLVLLTLPVVTVSADSFDQKIQQQNEKINDIKNESTSLDDLQRQRFNRLKEKSKQSYKRKRRRKKKSMPWHKKSKSLKRKSSSAQKYWRIKRVTFKRRNLPIVCSKKSLMRSPSEKLFNGRSLQ